MQRHLQLFVIRQPESIPLSQDYPVEIECVTIDVDLATGNVTLPGGCVCSLSGLMYALNQAKEAGFKYTLVRSLYVKC